MHVKSVFSEKIVTQNVASGDDRSDDVATTDETATVDGRAIESESIRIQETIAGHIN